MEQNNPFSESKWISYVNEVRVVINRFYISYELTCEVSADVQND